MADVGIRAPEQNGLLQQALVGYPLGRGTIDQRPKRLLSSVEEEREHRTSNNQQLTTDNIQHRNVFLFSSVVLR